MEMIKLAIVKEMEEITTAIKEVVTTKATKVEMTSLKNNFFKNILFTNV